MTLKALSHWYRARSCCGGFSRWLWRQQQHSKNDGARQRRHNDVRAGVDRVGWHRRRDDAGGPKAPWRHPTRGGVADSGGAAAEPEAPPRMPAPRRRGRYGGAADADVTERGGRESARRAICAPAPYSATRPPAASAASARLPLHHDSLFCGPRPCDNPDANTPRMARPDAMTPVCPMGSRPATLAWVARPQCDTPVSPAGSGSALPTPSASGSARAFTRCM